MTGGILDWVLITVSMIVFIYAIYIWSKASLNRKPRLQYYESWNIHPATLYSDAEVIQNSLFQMFYTIEILNVGEKAAGPVFIEIANLSEIEVAHEKRRYSVEKPILRWQPNTLSIPVVKDGVLVVNKIEEYMRAVLTIMIPLEKEKYDVRRENLPYIETVRYGAVPVARMTKSPIVNGTVEKLQERLQHLINAGPGNAQNTHS